MLKNPFKRKRRTRWLARVPQMPWLNLKYWDGNGAPDPSAWREAKFERDADTPAVTAEHFASVARAAAARSEHAAWTAVASQYGVTLEALLASQVHIRGRLERNGSPVKDSRSDVQVDG